MTELISEAGDESTQGCQTVYESLYFLLSGRNEYIKHDFYLVQVYFYSSSSHQKTKKLVCPNAKCTFKQVKFHIILLHQAECFFQVLNMFYADFTFDDYVINGHLHCLSHQRFEDSCNQPLICCTRIFQPIKHDIIIV